MNNISNFLQKFLILDKNNNARLAEILEVIKKETGMDLQKEMLQTKGDNLKINCSPIFRNEIFMHKQKIEEQLKERKIFLKVI